MSRHLEEFAEFFEYATETGDFSGLGEPACMTRRRVVVTGLGAVTPAGNDVTETWSNIVAGRSGIRAIDAFDVSEYASRIGGAVRDLDLSLYLTPRDARRMDPFIHYGLVASIQAIEDADLEVTEANAERIGVCVGSGIGGLPGIEKGHATLLNGGPRKVSPFFVPSNIINMVAGNLSIRYGIKGPNYSIVTACSTGAHCIGDAARMIERGDADCMLAGGTEMATSPTGLAGFASARALSTRNDDPEGASRPWDEGRDGFVLADGAGVVVLESLEHARAARRAHLRGDGRVRNEQRRVPHHPSPRRRGGRPALHAARARRCGGVARGRRLHQRPRHFDAGRRRDRDARGQGGIRRACETARDQLHQVDDRAHPGGGRGDRGDLLRARHPRRRSRLPPSTFRIRARTATSTMCPTSPGR